VKFKSLSEAWNEFFFTQQSPIPIALFRIIYGLLVIATILLLRPDWLAWYGSHAWVSLSTMQKFEPGMRLNVFAVIPRSDAWSNALFWIILASAIFLTMGFLTRFSSIVVYLGLASIQQRNLYITHGGDAFLRVAGFFLMFAPAGAAISVDRLVRIWRGREEAEVKPRSPWAQRMIQFELSLLYFVSFCWKIQGAAWINGTALYYAYHLDQLRRFPVPEWFLRPTILKLATWWALVLEFSLGVLIWIKDLRYILLAIGIFFHLCLEYSLNTPMFQWDVLSAYILFVYPADLDRAWNWIRSRIAPHLGEPVTVICDANSERARRIANVLRALDIFRRLSLTDLRAAQSEYEIPLALNRDRLLVVTPSGPRQGRDALQSLARVIPLLWPLALFSFLRPSPPTARRPV